MKSSAEKTSTTTSTPAAQAAEKPFFEKAGGGDFFKPGGDKAPPVQAKMTVNKPGDKFEQEADKMADKVMRMPDPAPGKEEKIQRAPEEKVQKREDDRIMKSAAMDDKKVQRQPVEKIQKAPAVEEKVQKAEAREEKVQKKPDDRIMRKEEIQKAEQEKIQKKEEEKVQRKSGEGGASSVAAQTQSAIHSQTTGGQQMGSETRGFMESRFGADFGNVRIHSDPEAASLSNQLSARAFTYQNHVFFARDQYQPGTSEGKHLLAHELTHTIQQGHAEQQSPKVSTAAATPTVQRLGIQDALDYFADKAYHIPGFRLLTIVLGFNPINMRSESRSAANILRGLIEVIPGGHFISQALDNHGVFNKAGAWVEQKLAELGDIGSDIVSGLKRFVDSLSWTDIFDLGGVWNRAKRIFTDPIKRLINFGISVAIEILKMVKDAILKPLAAIAQGTRGYDLLKAVLGEDPITGEPVPRNADTLIGGFMKLIGQEEVWENIKKGRAIQRAWVWFQGALAGLMGMVRAIPRKIIDTITSLTFQDIITVAGAFTKIVGSFANIALDFISWGVNQVISLLEILFSVVAPGAVPYVTKARSAFKKIIQNPIGFVGNLVRAGKLGFQNFANNILKHLKDALIKWITGPLGEAGVYIPKSFSLIEIIKLVLSVLGLTWQNIRAKLVKIIPEPVLTGLEKTAGILVTLVKDGPVAAWEQIKAELSELKDQLVSQITQMVSTEVVKAAVTKLVSMLNPAGAFVQAILAIYNTITFFIEKINQIAAVVGAFIDSIAAIAAGNVAVAAQKVEQTMANTLNIIIAFLAKFAGLGGIPAKITGIIRKIRQPIDRGLDKIVAWLGGMLKKIGGAIKKGVASFFSPKSFKVGNETHRLYPDSSGVPIVASNPKRLTEALKSLGGDVGKAIELETINNQIKTASDPAKQAELNKKADKLTADIIDLLVRLKYGEGTKDKMDKAVVNFTVEGNATEFKRQISMQQTSLTSMKVGDWQRNRARFVGFGRENKKDTKSTRREAMVAQLVSNPVDAIQSLRDNGLLTASDHSLVTGILTNPNIPDKKKALDSTARRIMDSYGSRKLAVLHRVDQVAGGDSTQYGDDASIFGGTYENSAIGRQWSTRIGIVDAAAKDVKPDAAVNVELKS